jgi:hypothetical protein
MREIKEIFEELLKSGMVNGHLDGPQKNVLVCDTVKDWVKAGNEIMDEGYDITSPGGYAGSSDKARKITWNEMWRSGKLYATVVGRKVLCFNIPLNIIPVDVNCDIVHLPKQK